MKAGALRGLELGGRGQSPDLQAFDFWALLTCLDIYPPSPTGTDLRGGSAWRQGLMLGHSDHTQIIGLRRRRRRRPLLHIL
jgi:hypothetical protein